LVKLLLDQVVVEHLKVVLAGVLVELAVVTETIKLATEEVRVLMDQAVEVLQVKTAELQAQGMVAS
jgi:hypothetical protein